MTVRPLINNIVLRKDMPKIGGLKLDNNLSLCYWLWGLAPRKTIFIDNYKTF